jgi:quinol monooxygenase YgiN
MLGHVAPSQHGADRLADRRDVVQWDGHANHFTLVEVWRDRKAFDASVTTPHNKEFRDKLTPLEGALYDERLYQLDR